MLTAIENLKLFSLIGSFKSLYCFQVPKLSSLRRICRRAADKASDPMLGEGILGGISERYEGSFSTTTTSYDTVVMQFQQVSKF